jgi:molybdopterin/thiamine biosynthesis adenylyltransferase
MNAADATILLVGAGGLGCPAGRALALSGVGRLIVADDDTVEGTNLHRQILFEEADLGRPKAVVAADRLEALGRAHGVRAEARQERFLPETAAGLLGGVDLVVEGSDNFPSKFVVADGCALHGVPVVQAGAVRWGGWALAVTASGPGAAHQTCLRCVFEEVPTGPALDCEVAGVIGPVVGVLGALQAQLALALLAGEGGALHSYDGRRDRLRRSAPRPRADCPHALGSIDDLESIDYLPDTTSSASA